MNKIHIQQGDLLLKRVENHKPGTGTTISRGRCVLAEGEVTNHAHVVEDDDAELIRDGERILLALAKQATLTHEEHGPITLEPGIWEVGRVQEYDYLTQMKSPVQD